MTILPHPSQTSMSNEASAYDHLLAYLRSRPEGEAIIAENFLDSDAAVALERFWHSNEWLATSQTLAPQPGHWVLDCGAGRCLAATAFARLGCRVVALDINPHPHSGLGILRSHPAFANHSVYPVVGLGESLMFPHETFDIVYCREMLHHARDLDLLVQDLVRALKCGGVLYATREHRHPWWSSDKQFRRNHPAVQFGIEEHSYLASAYRRAFCRAGLRQVEIRPVVPTGDRHWTAAAHYRLAACLARLPIVGAPLYGAYVRLRLYRLTGSLITIIGRKPTA